MKLVLTLLVRDEEDIIEQNLLYHLNRGVDQVVVTDNNSTDGTRDILEQYARTGAVHIIDERDDTYAQASWVTRMARLACSEHEADWIIHCDADEFWWPHRGDLKSCLAAIPEAFGVVRAPIFDFVPVPDESRPVEVRMVVRKARHGKFKVAHRADPGVSVSMGNHRLDETSLDLYPRRPPIMIFHFPARSYRQYETKIVNGGAAVARNPQLPFETCQHWRQLYACFQDGQLEDHYRREVLHGSRQLIGGLMTHHLVIDRRLRRFLGSLRDPTPART
jgi:hypothetical protein